MRWALVVLAGCLSPDLVPCGDELCPQDAVCAPRGCVGREAFSACVGKLEAEACTTSLISAGACHGSACTDIVCGDAVLDNVEACDDGNLVSGDGCSAECTSNEACGNGVIDVQVGEDCDDNNVLSSDGCNSTCRIEQAMWTEVSPRRIAPRAKFTMAYLGSLVGFGGTDGQRLFGETFVFTGSSWARLATPTTPPARAGHVMVTHPARNEIVMFGGVGAAGLLADTWVFDGLDWTERAPAMSPPPRVDATAAYDPIRGRIVLYGGTQIGLLAPLDDTWEWDGTTWTLVDSGKPDTLPLIRPAMAWDASTPTMVLYGWGGIEPYGETRTRNGGGWSATQDLGVPEALHSVAMTYNPVTQNILVVGGITGNGSPSGQTWEWDQGWTKVGTATLVARSDASAAAIGPSVYVFGGFTASGPTSEMFTLGSSWAPVELQPLSPSPRWGTPAAYSPRIGSVVIHGGADATSFSMDTHWFDERGWTQDLTDTLQPSRRHAHAMATTPSGTVLMFGGSSDSGQRLDETYERDGYWIQHQPTTAPSPRAQTALASDFARDRVVLFGGEAGPPGHETQDTWLWDGTNWNEAQVAAPPPRRYAHAMAYDRVRERVVLFGGRTANGTTLNDTWEWDGTAWTAIPSATRPLARYDHALAYDPQRRRVVLFGGRSADVAPLADTWEWDGATWTRVFTPTFPPPRARPSLAYDDIRRQLVLFGGRDLIGTDFDDTWILEYASTEVAHERCVVATDDLDNDGFAGCADPDCWGRCTPDCPPGTSCASDAPRCGDGDCGFVETHLLCPSDCP